MSRARSQSLCRVELRQERSDLFFGIDDLDDSGEIARRIDAEFVIDPIAVAVAQRPMENSCACEPCLERRLNASAVKRPPGSTINRPHNDLDERDPNRDPNGNDRRRQRKREPNRSGQPNICHC